MTHLVATCRFLGPIAAQKSSPWLSVTLSVTVAVVQERLTQAWETLWLVSSLSREVR